MLRTIRVMTLLSFALLPMPPCASGEESLASIRAHGALRVAVKNEGSLNREEHNDPAHFQKRGFELQLAGAIAGEILGKGAKLELETFKRRARLPAVADGTVDMAICMIPINAQNLEVVDLSEPYYHAGLAVLQAGKSTIITLKDLDGMTVSALDEKTADPGGTLRELVRQAGAEIKVRRFRTFDEAIEALTAGGVDAMVSEGANLDAFIAFGHRNLKRSPLLSHSNVAVAVRKGNSDLLKVVNRVISRLRESGTLEQMKRKWNLQDAVAPGQ